MFFLNEFPDSISCFNLSSLNPQTFGFFTNPSGICQRIQVQSIRDGNHAAHDVYASRRIACPAGSAAVRARDGRSSGVGDRGLGGSGQLILSAFLREKGANA